ncbi:hypothetical protein DL89DRAFT_286222 [Linderina pennispora]|uniref:Uncharacterized protein n=1 Tax=Linderina pennispora TaxID=61395 RepID=A0A1Y1VZQ7_9FUNG|nr:uncharacterized protein DL89DRAFT_286222 [Linderina pennispora]ORX66496.1 hypothetical protein DL89DRAFT_286222 [Linderina pennispora]
MAQTLQSQAPFRLIQPHNSEQQHAIQSLVQELERLSPDMFANTSGNERLALELPFAQPAPTPAAAQTTMPAAGFVSLVPQPLAASIASSPAAAGPQAATAPTQPASPAAPLFSAMPMSQQPSAAAVYCGSCADRPEQQPIVDVTPFTGHRVAVWAMDRDIVNISRLAVGRRVHSSRQQQR